MTNPGLVLRSRSGLRATVCPNGSLQALDWRELSVNLFPGHSMERGPANIHLRRRTPAGLEVHALLGPGPDATLEAREDMLVWRRSVGPLRASVSLRLAQDAPAWFWHVLLDNEGEAPEQVDLFLTQDLGLSSHAALRLNEHYVSQYLDHTPLQHPRLGWVMATRQNLPTRGEHPWCVTGSLREAVAFATDGLQVTGLHAREGTSPGSWPGLARGLPGARLQHEHAMAALQDAPVLVEPGKPARAGFFGLLEANHAPTAAGDVEAADRALGLPEASSPGSASPVASCVPHRLPESLFDTAPALPVQDLAEPELLRLFGPDRREEEHEAGELLSFFHGDHCHVVLHGKDSKVLRPHGHLLRTGGGWTTDESSLASTAWMGGIFHSMVTQGHVARNRLLSTHRSYIGLYRSLGQRLFVQVGPGEGPWQLLQQPSAWEVSPSSASWYYRHAAGLIRVVSRAGVASHELEVRLEVLDGPPVRALLTNHLALDGDDGALALPVPVEPEGRSVLVRPPAGSDMAARFPQGGFRIEASPDTPQTQVGGDELLYLDGVSRGQPWLCLVAGPAPSMAWRITGELIPDLRGPADTDENRFWREATAGLALQPSGDGAHAQDLRRLGEMMPWLAHDALVHYLAPRGLEQFSGGGWGTRDVCQGPVEYLLALGRTEPVRDLLLKVFRAQNPDGDWPQWFAFYERDADSRAGDSHGDIVFWPLLALGQYLTASGDGSVLEEPVAFHSAEGGESPALPVLAHVERALDVIAQRRIPGTALAAYGHGDWNDSLQPADPRMRESLCSTWTVTLHAQMLRTLAEGLQRTGEAGRAADLSRQADEVAAAFQQWLVVDGVAPGYVHFQPDGGMDHLLHPRDIHTGLRYSLLPMVHAVLNELFTPEQARDHLALIREHLHGPDGARLFDRPMAYRGGEQRFFQRAETSTFFGREIGLMYMHAHLRYAEALWHCGDAAGFLQALGRFNPIGLRDHVPSATPRQSNCYYSSSDAAFADRYEADARYEEALQGRVPLEGGWRVYSSGAGIGFGLVLRGLLGLRFEHQALVVDPVMTRGLDGLVARVRLLGHDFELRYRVSADAAPVTGLRLNGQALDFERDANRYRIGAARVSLALAKALLVEGVNRLEVKLG